MTTIEMIQLLDGIADELRARKDKRSFLLLGVAMRLAEDDAARSAKSADWVKIAEGLEDERDQALARVAGEADARSDAEIDRADLALRLVAANARVVELERECDENQAGCARMRSAMLADLAAARAEIDAAGAVLGQVVCAATLLPHESLSAPIDHAAVHAILSVLEDRNRLHSWHEDEKNWRIGAEQERDASRADLEREKARADQTRAKLEAVEAALTSRIVGVEFEARKEMRMLPAAMQRAERYRAGLLEIRSFENRDDSSPDADWWRRRTRGVIDAALAAEPAAVALSEACGMCDDGFIREDRRSAFGASTARIVCPCQGGVAIDSPPPAADLRERLKRALKATQDQYDIFSRGFALAVDWGRDVLAQWDRDTADPARGTDAEPLVPERTDEQEAIEQSAKALEADPIDKRPRRKLVPPCELMHVRCSVCRANLPASVVHECAVAVRPECSFCGYEHSPESGGCRGIAELEARPEELIACTTCGWPGEHEHAAPPAKDPAPVPRGHCRKCVYCGGDLNQHEQDRAVCTHCWQFAKNATRRTHCACGAPYEAEALGGTR